MSDIEYTISPPTIVVFRWDSEDRGITEFSSTCPIGLKLSLTSEHWNNQGQVFIYRNYGAYNTYELHMYEGKNVFIATDATHRCSTTFFTKDRFRKPQTVIEELWELL